MAFEPGNKIGISWIIRLLGQGGAEERLGMKLVMSLVVTFAAICSFAYTETVDGITWTYTVSDGKASVGGGSSSSPAVPITTTGAITIPSTLGGKTVTSVGAYAFSGCSGLTSVTIPDSVTSVGSSAFEGCSGLAGITIPDSVTSIGNGTFYDCANLASVMIGNGVTNIGSSAFYNCSNIANLTIGDSVTSIDSWAFYGCSGLRDVTVSQGFCTNRIFTVFPHSHQTITNVVISMAWLPIL